MKSETCVVIDYGIGNVFSVMQALKACGTTAVLTSDAATIKSADRVILPGVGSFGRAADRLRNMGLDETIYEYLRTERPFLGICVGMQVLLETGHEFGVHKGLGLFEGQVGRIDMMDDSGLPYRVPIIGWHKPALASTAAFQGSAFGPAFEKGAFYFVHSYCATLQNESEVMASVEFGRNKIVSAIQKDNILGVQFHPERSAKSGQMFLNQFLAL